MSLPVLTCLIAAASAAGPRPAAIDPHAATTGTASQRRNATPERAAEPRELLGRWQEVAEPHRIVELRAGGTGTIGGLPLTWSVEGDRLTITDPGGTDTVGWRVDGARLVLAGPFETELVLVRR